MGKTGQGARKKSVLQQWKLRALAFLDPYILRRGSGSEMGRVSISIDSVCVTFFISHFTLSSTACVKLFPFFKHTCC